MKTLRWRVMPPILTYSFYYELLDPSRVPRMIVVSIALLSFFFNHGIMQESTDVVYPLIPCYTGACHKSYHMYICLTVSCFKPTANDLLCLINATIGICWVAF